MRRSVVFEKQTLFDSKLKNRKLIYYVMNIGGFKQKIKKITRKK